MGPAPRGAGPPAGGIGEPTPRPSWRASSAETSAPSSSPVPSGAPDARSRSRTAGSTARSRPPTASGGAPAPPEHDLVEDRSVPQDEDTVGVGGGFRVVGDQDHRLAALGAEPP